ncbi:YceI family protein [Rothia sp. AR01]|uniref:YceI family protein n=1 Tax=Rothia santali TaxID=2949643 RepID=A0A9X2HEM5_9MICC|nr:YceI family protein [Rothia santali]MCP3426900.1 YceI family protein [Rothia santali]
MTTLDGLVPGAWTFDPAHSEIGFSVRHAGISTVRGTFHEAVASLEVGEDVDDSSVSATIQAASIDTGQEARDGHVKSADFFDVEAYPELTFASTAFRVEDDEVSIDGELTIRDQTRPVTLKGEFGGVAVDAFGQTRAGFSVAASISRKEFGITWNAALEAGGVLVSDKVKISLDVAFLAPAA